MHARPSAELETLRARIRALEQDGRPAGETLPFGVAPLGRIEPRVRAAEHDRDAFATEAAHAPLEARQERTDGGGTLFGVQMPSKIR